MSSDRQFARAEAILRRHSLAFPETHEDHPWGECAFKVKSKVFLFLYRKKGLLSLSVKLPVSGRHALSLSFASPTGYGLGKSGWVTAKFENGIDVPVEMIQEWVDESYRAVAPKRVVAILEDEATLPPKAKPTKRKRSNQ